MQVRVVDGNLLDQDVEAIVNAWNRNIIPRWLLLLGGVSRAIKQRAGPAPFTELARHGAIPLGGAVATGAGHLPFKAIIHVAGINLFWRASRESIEQSVRNAMRLAEDLKLRSIAFPLIGAGSGGVAPQEAERIMLETLSSLESPVSVHLVRYAAPPPS